MDMFEKDPVLEMKSERPHIHVMEQRQMGVAVADAPEDGVASVSLDDPFERPPRKKLGGGMIFGIVGTILAVGMALYVILFGRYVQSECGATGIAFAYLLKEKGEGNNILLVPGVGLTEADKDSVLSGVMQNSGVDISKFEVFDTRTQNFGMRTACYKNIFGK